MRVAKLALENFRGFVDASIRFEKDLTVLVGLNGAGKTTVLEALARSVETAFRSVWVQQAPPPGWPTFPDWTEDDVREGANEALLSLDYQWLGEWISLQTKLRNSPLLTWSAVPSVTKEEPRTDKAFLFQLEMHLRSDGAFPLAVWLGAKRRRSPGPDAPQGSVAFAAQQDALDGEQDTPSENFYTWFREQEDLENEERVRGASSYRAPSLELVRSAITELLGSTYTQPRFDRKRRKLVLTKNGSTLSISSFSEGERRLIGLVGELVRRLSLAGEKNLSHHAEALVLIDEVELHLHPEWQRSVLPQLVRTFPKCQFVVTTHSPQVLASVEPRCVRVLTQGRIEPTAALTLGRDSNTLLESVLQAHRRPKKVLELIAAIQQLLDQNALAEAANKLRELRNLVGDDDPEVISLDNALWFASDDAASS